MEIACCPHSYETGTIVRSPASLSKRGYRHGTTEMTHATKAHTAHTIRMYEVGPVFFSLGKRGFGVWINTIIENSCRRMES